MRWWPPVGLAAMALLGVVVGKGATPVDAWFQHLGSRMGSDRRDFLLVTYPPLVAVVLLAAIVVAVRRGERRLAVIVAVCPIIAIIAVQILKRAFGRYKGGGLAYPSGHTTFLIVVLGLAVVVAGATLWAVIVATGLGVLGMFGQAITYHYFTDTVGAALLATSMVCVAALMGRAATPPRPT